MDSEIIDLIRAVFHYGSFALLGFGIGLAVFGLVRPKAFSKVFHEFSQRRFILLTGVFVCLLAGTIFTITYPSPNTTLQSNAPSPTTHGPNELQDIDESMVPQDTAQTAQPKVAEPKAATPTKPQSDSIRNSQPQTKQQQSGSSVASPPRSTAKTPSSSPQQPNTYYPDQNQDKTDKCRLELLFICL